MKVYLCPSCGWVGMEEQLWRSVSKLLCPHGPQSHKSTVELTNDNFEELTTPSNSVRARQLLDMKA